MHSRVDEKIVEAHIKDWTALSPPVTIRSPYIIIGPNQDGAKEQSTAGPYDLDTPDELSLRSLLLGIVHRTVGEYGPSRAFLLDARSRQAEIETSTWISSVALFELAVLDLKEIEAIEKAIEAITPGGRQYPGAEEMMRLWTAALQSASEKLDQTLGLLTSDMDLSSRLDSRIAMLRDEIAIKKEMLAMS